MCNSTIKKECHAVSLQVQDTSVAHHSHLICLEVLSVQRGEVFSHFPACNRSAPPLLTSLITCQSPIALVIWWHTYSYRESVLSRFIFKTCRHSSEKHLWQCIFQAHHGLVISFFLFWCCLDFLVAHGPEISFPAILSSFFDYFVCLVIPIL